MIDRPLQAHEVGASSLNAFGRFGKSGSYNEWENHGCFRVHLESQQFLQ